MPGEALVEPYATSIGQVGLLTCYDMRFPEAALRLRRQGAEIISYPSAFTVRTGEAHWELLLRARAVETQCYVLGSAQTGTHFEEAIKEDGSVAPARRSFGHSTIVDPWGTVVAQVSDEPDSEAPKFVTAE